MAFTFSDPSATIGGYSINPSWSRAPAVQPPAPVAAPGPTAAGNTAAAISAGQTVNNQLPGYNASLGNIGANISSETAGQLPADVLRLIQQQGAERGVATGTSGSANNNAAYLQALGLTSLDLTQRGQNNFQSILPTLPGAQVSQNPMNYTSTAQEYEAQLQNSVNESAASAANASLAAAGNGYNAGSAGAPGGIAAPAPYSPSFTAPDYGGVGVMGAPAGAGTVVGGNSTLATLQNILKQYDPNNDTTDIPNGAGGVGDWTPSDVGNPVANFTSGADGGGD